MSGEPTMIERVARAILREQEKEPFPNNLNLARAAIEAMREPTDAMLRPSDDFTDRAHNAELFGLMIDAALNEHADAR